MTYEMSFELQKSIKNQLNKNNYVFKMLKDAYDLNEFQNSHNNLMNQFFKTENIYNEESISWQIRVRIIEIKNLTGSNQNVFCVIQIGDNIFRTKQRHIDKLQFNNGDDNQVSHDI